MAGKVNPFPFKRKEESRGSMDIPEFSTVRRFDKDGCGDTIDSASNYVVVQYPFIGYYILTFSHEMSNLSDRNKSCQFTEHRSGKSGKAKERVSEMPSKIQYL